MNSITKKADKLKSKSPKSNGSVKDNSLSPMIRFSGATFKSAAGKIQSLDKKGELAPPERVDRSGGRSFCRETTWTKYVEYRRTAKPNKLFNSGNYSNPDKFNGLTITTKGKADGITSVAMSNEYLSHIPDVASIARIDVDYKDPKKIHGVYPKNLMLPDTPDALEEQLLDLLPELKNCAYMILDSSSSMLTTAKGKHLTGASGYRVEIPIADGSKIPEFMEKLHKICWALDYGWAWVGAAGDIFLRSYVDLALKSPHQPDYAVAELRDGIKQDRRFLVRDGKFFDPDAIKPLSKTEEADAVSNMVEARTELELVAKKVKAKVQAQEVKILVENGVEKKRAKKIVGHLHEAGVLSGEMEVQFEKETVSVANLILDGEDYDEAQCFDPLEPDYAGDKPVAIYYSNDGLHPGIYTQAHGGKFYHLRLDKEGLEKLIISGIESDEIARCIALSKLPEISETQIIIAAAKKMGLGNRTKMLSDKVAEFKALMVVKIVEGAESGENENLTTLENGDWPVNKAIPTSTFPFTDEKGGLIAHMENYQHMLNGYGISVGYDVIKKDAVWSGPEMSMDTDNAYLGLFSKVKSLAALNRLPHGSADLNAHLPAIADLTQLNPVHDYLSALRWDKKDRFKLLVREMGVHDEVVAEITLRIWFTGAAAACEHFETGIKLINDARPCFEYVLALLGEQGVNKTKGFLRLVPSALAKYAKDGLSLDPKSKDSVKIAVSYWLAELGELDATFTLGAISVLKAFLSNETDEFRLAYAQGYSKFKRRTAFIGTVNQDKFLKDATGNRRYLALECANGFPTWPDAEVDQLWAQAWARYVGGAQWWPTESEQKLLDTNAENFRQQSWAELRIRELFDFTQPPGTNKRANVTEIWVILKGGYTSGTQQEVQPKQLNDVGTAMKTLWLEHGAFKHKGAISVKTKKQGVVKIYADGGKNKGWLLPMTIEEVRRIEARAKSEAEAKATNDALEKVLSETTTRIKTEAKAKGEKLTAAEVNRRAKTEIELEQAENERQTGAKRRFPRIKKH
jgi:predicted P-loop ATPase